MIFIGTAGAHRWRVSEAQILKAVTARHQMPDARAKRAEAMAYQRTPAVVLARSDALLKKCAAYGPKTATRGEDDDSARLAYERRIYAM